MAILIFLVLVCLYFVPTLYAWHKDNPDWESILLLNLFLGWTFVGWVIAVIWAAKKK